VAVTTVGGTAAHVASYLVLRRARILRSFSTPEALLAMTSLTGMRIRTLPSPPSDAGLS